MFSNKYFLILDCLVLSYGGFMDKYICRAFDTSRAFETVKTTLISASSIIDPLASITEAPRKLRTRRRISRFFLRVALRRLGLV